MTFLSILFTPLYETLSIREFEYLRLSFNRAYLNDKDNLDYLFEEGSKLAKLVNTHPANNSISKRSAEIVLANSISGLLAEYCWKTYINHYLGREFIAETSPVDLDNQIDLEIIGRNITLEVRSSFVRNGIVFALSDPVYQFDILGPYTSEAKSNEFIKDFYLRTLYHYDPIKFLSHSNELLYVYLTGGATREMMLDPKYYVMKTLQEKNALGKQETRNFRVIPISLGLDTKEILEVIKKLIN